MDDPVVGLRRTARGPLLVGDEPALVERIVAEITAGGPLTFARFMELALYEPGLGYYRRPRPGPGREGDFLTAPETHPLFGRAIARQVADVWERLGRPEAFAVREHGAGEGALAVAMLDGLARESPALLGRIRYEAVEVEPARIDALALRLAHAGHASRWRPPGIAAEPITGVVLANEVLDALPVHRVEQAAGRLRERHVDHRDGRLVEVRGDPSTPALAARLAGEDVALRDGQLVEISLAIEPWIRDAVAGLDRGLLLLVDYGYPAAELYGPRRLAGTLAAYVNHRVHDDPLVNVGRQDLTAHVDLTAVDRAALGAGLDRLGSTTQAEFLVGLGLEAMLDEARAESAESFEAQAALRAGVMRLLDPAATGGFKVLGYGRGIAADPPLRGFSFELRAPGTARRGSTRS